MAKKKTGRIISSTTKQKNQFIKSYNFWLIVFGVIGIPAVFYGSWIVLQRVTDKPQLHVREAVPMIRPGTPVEVKLTFSVVGKRFVPIFVNKVLLREDVQQPSFVVQVRDVRDVRTIKGEIEVTPPQKPAPIVSIRTADDRELISLPDSPIHEIFREARKRMDAQDQLDFLLTIRVKQASATVTQETPAFVKWIGLEVLWEDADGSPGLLAKLVYLPLVDLRHYKITFPGQSKSH
jgi:hypothetical protein